MLSTPSLRSLSIHFPHYISLLTTERSYPPPKFHLHFQPNYKHTVSKYITKEIIISNYPLYRSPSNLYLYLYLYLYISKITSNTLARPRISYTKAPQNSIQKRKTKEQNEKNDNMHINYMAYR